ncbi:DUF3672 domain-containing protein [Aeromonas veronii]|uniref:DUF3672 domain-containing protein n=1 Tax=Aeromonas veronii TaxID=654 RepID=UPI001F3900FD|nr:DUF3672 domain-containing protein [Aeromonas veronii]MCF5894726.1 DUF3672 domain-containing protein [Aeromonas veronii]
MSESSFRASNTQQGLTENMQILTGQKGDRLDKALTLREAAALGMVNLRRNNSGAVVPELPPDKPTDPEWSGVQPPVAPTSVTADGAFHTITLTWDSPGYKGHSYAEILRAEVDNPANAVVIGTTLANVYSDTVGKGFLAFYWVRFVNKNGMVGPLHNTAGLRATTNPDVDEIIASATNFAIYNPATPNEKEIIFGVTDDGKVAIREAIIKAAAIQIIHSEKITADYIKAGVSLSAPLISGGQIDMGNAFLSGGSAGFGKGGPYSAWGWGWYTMIYADGSVYTNRLRAEGGYVRNMTIGNCTIEQDCVVRGTVYANKIVGDVVRMHAMQNDASISVSATADRSRLVALAITVCSGNSWTRCDIYVNGSIVKSVRADVIAVAGGSSISTYTAMETYTLRVPPGNAYSIKFVKSAGNAESYNFPGAVGVLMIDAQV